MDITAHNALRNVESEERAKELILVIRYIVRNSGFELVERIQLRDKRTGRKYK